MTDPDPNGDDLVAQTDNGPRPEDPPQDDVSQDPDVVVLSDEDLDAEVPA